jgi:hypothetical protein
MDRPRQCYLSLFEIMIERAVRRAQSGLLAISVSITRMPFKARLFLCCYLSFGELHGNNRNSPCTRNNVQQSAVLELWNLYQLAFGLIMAARTEHALAM